MRNPPSGGFLFCAPSTSAASDMHVLFIFFHVEIESDARRREGDRAKLTPI